MSNSGFNLKALSPLVAPELLEGCTIGVRRLQKGIFLRIFTRRITHLAVTADSLSTMTKTTPSEEPKSAQLSAERVAREIGDPSSQRARITGPPGRTRLTESPRMDCTCANSGISKSAGWAIAATLAVATADPA